MKLYCDFGQVVRVRRKSLNVLARGFEICAPRSSSLCCRYLDAESWICELMSPLKIAACTMMEKLSA